MNSKYLSIPIWIGILLALTFPYYGLNFSKWGLVALFILSLINIFSFNFKESLGHNKQNWQQISFNLLIGYTLLPSIQLILAYLLLKNTSLQLGYLLAAIAPIAVVTPQFLADKKQKDQSVIYILISTLLYPVLCFFYLYILGFDRFGIHITPIIKDVLILTLLPVIISLFTELILPNFKNKITNSLKPLTPTINMSLIGFLVFIYFGSSFTKTNFSELNLTIWISILIIALAQDFLALYLFKFFKFNQTEQICFAIKNVALSGGVLLIFHPQGILACSSVLAAHALVYSILSHEKLKKLFFNYR